MSQTIGNPQINQGTLNVIRTNLQVPAFPQLNVTQSFMGAGGASISWTGPATTFINTMTGRVVCPEPVQPVTITVHLVRAQALAALWEQQRVSLTPIGDVLLYGDSMNLPPYSVSNCAIENVGELTFNARSVEFGVTIGGTYTMNNGLWSLIV